MPAESQRIYRRVAARDRWFLALVVCLALVGTPAAVLLRPQGSGVKTDVGCVSTVRAGIVGGGTYTYCGARARAVCRQLGNEDAGLAAQCRELGLLRRR